MSTPVWTPVVEGLRKKPTKKPGVWSYQSTVYFDGGSDQKSDSFTSDTAAKKWHRQRQHDLDQGIKPARKDMTFAQLKDESWDKLIGVSAETLRNYKSALKRIPESDPIWRVRLDHFDAIFGRKFLARLLALVKSDENPDGYASTTINETWAVVRTVLRYGRDEGHMTIDPFAGTPRRLRPSQDADEENVKEALGPVELDRLIQTVQADAFVSATDTVYTNLIVQAFMEGERISETLGARWGVDVDLVDEILITRGTKTKKSKKRPQAAQPETVEAWERQLEVELAKGLGQEGDLVFTDATGEPISRYAAREAVMRAGKLAGLGHVTPMNGRKTVATADDYAGVEGKLSADALGHSDLVARKHYRRSLKPSELVALRDMRDKRKRFFDLGRSDGPVLGPVLEADDDSGTRETQ